ncbi:related to endo-1,6-alpha-D-mannanase [Phialocephala subalpina]|uniref:Related to endo-1,6-alpha-D-mannanase n=1 Tax=Phialocephala subalpina TaxID=576137 RepID=A0A1L7XWG6_9HELO|nr:related to endo-1,6-alpha-D-mannanase [Phialocephala subalpina]
MFFSLPRTLAVLTASIAISNALPHPVAQPETSPNPSWHQLSELSSTGLHSRATQTQYISYAVAGINQMMTWYSAANGLWSNAWWDSANAITMLADFQQYFPSYATGVTATVFPTTLAKAPSTFAGFLNGFYDDELWWALAWIQVYDVTGQETYLDTAAAIFEDAKSAWGTSPCGGLWWDKAHTGVGAVENELYLTAAAKLANRRPSTPSQGYYFAEALKAYTWFINSGLINSDNTINNGLVLSTCKNDGNYVFSYNQGILLSGLAELTWSTGDSKYNELANTIATAAISALTDANGILHEPCEATGCDADEEQFKGVFGRNIQFLVNRATVLPAATKTLFVNFLTTNANAIWADDQVDNQLGLVWSGPSGTATIQTQSSALDAIVGAAAVS